MDSVLKLTWSQAAAWRTRRHFLDRRAPAGSMLEIASRLCGLHAQVMSSAVLTLWARVEDLDRDAVRRALWDERTLVKTWAMRGTLHLLPSAELSFWHAALASSRRYGGAAMWRRFGLTLAQIDRLSEAIGAVLNGDPITREDLAKKVGRVTRSRALGAHLEQSWGTILKPAAFAGRLCFGPSVGQRVRFARPDAWLAAAGHELTPWAAAEPARTHVTRRFLAAYGPATVHDLARWWGGAGGLTEARKSLAGLGDEVTEVEVEGTRTWMLAADAREARDAAPEESVRLLPAFDQYVIGASAHAHHLLPSAALRARVYRAQGWISPVLLVGGLMKGVWRHELKGSQVEVVVEPFARPSSTVRRAAAIEAERLAAFLGATLTLVRWI